MAQRPHPRIRVAIVAVGRFHVLDLARELDALGCDVRFYSAVPPEQTERLGLPKRATRWLGPIAAASVLASRRAPRALADRMDQLALLTLDRLAAARLEPCDVLVVLSGLGLEVIEAARTKFGAQVFLGGGSRHGLGQRAILEGMPPSVPARPVEPMALWRLQRELAGYALADRIAIPSRVVERSFVAQGVDARKLFRNPYGTSLDMFPPTPVPPHPPLRIAMVGGWSRRKGVDVLVRAWRELPGGTELMHVGPVIDHPLPEDRGFTHVEPVPQAELTKYYARAHVMALASREEGLALVQAQALSSGVPVVCTDRTGGEDLAETLQSDALSVVPADDVTALRDALQTALARVGPPGAPRSAVRDPEALSWRAYGRRYLAELERTLGREPSSISVPSSAGSE